jgi:hypothetical protein
MLFKLHFQTVRRQDFSHQLLFDLQVSSVHLVSFIMLRAVCDVSVALRVPSVIRRLLIRN